MASPNIFIRYILFCSCFCTMTKPFSPFSHFSLPFIYVKLEGTDQFVTLQAHLRDTKA